MRQSPVTVIAASIAWVALMSACDGAGKPSGPPPAKIATSKRNLPNIIFLTVDTLRADHLARYGYERNTMPAIEAFADTAVVFDQAVVPRGSTRPSYASMLTGLYPFRHGVRSNGVTLHEDLLTLPEMLKAVGYHTAAFVSNFVLIGEMSGCDQGFDVYDDRLDDREAQRANFERTAPHTLRAILEWLESGPPEPFFLFTNFIDPHGPYDPPARYRAMFQSTETRELRPEQVPRYQRREGELDFFDYRDRYDAEIRYTDAALGVLIEELKKKGLWDGALVVFTADHGESMGEHDTYFAHHMHLWEETTRVPFAVRLPGAGTASSTARRVGGISSPMDLMPTVAALLEISHDRSFDGENLLPVLTGAGEIDPQRAIFVEFPNVATPHETHADYYAVRMASHKLLKVLDPNAGQLVGRAYFDIACDPLEQKPVPFDAADEIHRQLQARLDALIAEARTFTLPFVVTEYEMPLEQRADFVANRKDTRPRHVKTLTAEQIERLRSLGYVE